MALAMADGAESKANQFLEKRDLVGDRAGDGDGDGGVGGEDEGIESPNPKEGEGYGSGRNPRAKSRDKRRVWG